MSRFSHKVIAETPLLDIRSGSIDCDNDVFLHWIVCASLDQNVWFFMHTEVKGEIVDPAQYFGSFEEACTMLSCEMMHRVHAHCSVEVRIEINEYIKSEVTQIMGQLLIEEAQNILRRN